MRRPCKLAELSMRAHQMGAHIIFNHVLVSKGPRSLVNHFVIGNELYIVVISFSCREHSYMIIFLESTSISRYII